MFSILINGSKVDSSGITVNLYLKSTFPFSPDQGLIEGSYAFNGILPASPVNKRIFGFPHRLEGLFDLPTDINCQLSINGRIWYDGLISITSATERSFSFDLALGYGYFSSLIDDKTLKDLNFPNPINTGSDTQDLFDFAEECIIRSFPQVNLNFPTVYAPGFYGDSGDVNPSFIGFINHRTSSGFTPNYLVDGAVYNINTFVPMLYLAYVTKLCFETFGYKATGKFFEDPEVCKILLYNNFALDEFRQKYLVIASQTGVQYPDEWETIAFDDDSSGSNQDDDDCFDTSAHSYIISEEGDYAISLHLELFNGSMEERDFEIRLMLDGLPISTQTVTISEEDAGTWQSMDLSFDHTFSETDIGSVLVFQIHFHWFIPDVEHSGIVRNASVCFENISLSRLNVFSNQISFVNHVPDTDIASFLIDLQMLFGIVICFDHEQKIAEVSFIRDILTQLEADDLSEFTARSSNKITFEKKTGYSLQFSFDTSDSASDLIKDPVLDDKYLGEFDTFADLPFPVVLDSTAYVRNTNSYYIYNILDGPGAYWNLLAHNFPLKVIGDGVKEVKPAISPMMMIRHPSTRSVYPYILGEGTSLAFDDSQNDCGLRIMLYHGLRPFFIDPTQTYPFASSVAYDSLGNTIGNLNLRFDGDKGLFENYLSAYYYWLDSKCKQVKLVSHLNFSQLKNLDLLKIHRIFNSRFLIKEAKVPVNNSKLAKIELDCRTV